MPLEISPDGPFDRPVVVCDHCGEQIEDAKDGNYQYRIDERGFPHGPLYFTHKECCLAFEAADPERGVWSATELDYLPLYLVNNLKVDLKETEARDRLFSQ
jgi:hypothetical protein